MTRSAHKIKVAIAGIGNCASSLVQGVEYYRDADPSDRVPGLMHVTLGGYHVGDTEFVAAFDVDAAKVGLDLSKAVFASNNNTIRFSDVPALGVTSSAVRRSTGSALLPQDRRGVAGPPVDVADVLRRSGAEVLSPTFRSAPSRRRSTTRQRPSKPAWRSSTPSPSSSPATPSGPTASPRRACRSSATTSRARSAPRSCTGSSPGLFEDRGIVARPHLPAQRGRQHGFQNMLEPERLESKKISKTQAVTSQIDRAVPTDSCTSGLRTMCRGSRTASWPTSAWRAAISATCR